MSTVICVENKACVVEENGKLSTLNCELQKSPIIGSTYTYFFHSIKYHLHLLKIYKYIKHTCITLKSDLTIKKNYFVANGKPYLGFISFLFISVYSFSISEKMFL